MSHAFFFAWRRFLSTLTMGMFLLGSFTAIVIGIGIFGSPIESRMFPVLPTQQISMVEREGDEVTFTLRLFKARDCRIASAGWILYSGERPTPITVYNSAGVPAAGLVTYKTGWLLLGPLTFKIPQGIESPERLEAILYYDCHPGWLVKQNIDPIPIPGET